MLYNHTKSGDTIIINRERFKGLLVTEKRFEGENIIVNIENQTSSKSGFTFQTRSKVKWIDSSRIESKYYKQKGIITQIFIQIVSFQNG